MTSIICKGESIQSITVQHALNNNTPLLLTFPHSGEYYPDDFLPNPALSFEVIDFPNDKYVDELFDSHRSLGLPSIRANFPRTYIDVNRHQHNIDPSMMETQESWYGRFLSTDSEKENGGTLFWSKTKLGNYDLYNRKLSQDEMKQRIATCYVPFHQALASSIEDMKKNFNVAYILDCHSYAEFSSKFRGGERRPQVDVLNRHGQSCDHQFTECVVDAFSDCGYDVTLNKIYTGGEMLLRYGWPQIDQHALQFEIRRDLYMDEESRQKSGQFTKMQNDCSKVLSSVKRHIDNL